MDLPCLTQLDVLRLERQSHNVQTEVERDRLDDLLASAHIVPGEEIPEDVITMNSVVVYRDLDTGVAHETTLVYPELADSGNQRLSVTSAVGIALIGAQQGQRVIVDLPKGQQRALQILAIPFQPEAAGQFHL